MGNKAENKKRFEEAWEEEFAQMRKLCWSLPPAKARDFADRLEVLKEYVKEASAFAYPEEVTQ